MAYLDGSRSSFPYAIDQIRELRDLSPSQKERANRYQELVFKENRTPQEEIELNDLAVELQDYMPSPEVWNKFGDMCIAMQKHYKENTIDFINELKDDMISYTNNKKQEIVDVVTNAENSINNTKDNALIAIENKKQNVIEYLDGTTAGALRNDVGDMSQSIIEGRSLIDKTNALKIQVDSNTEEVNKIGDLTQLETEEKNTIVGAINEHSAQMAELVNIELPKKLDKTSYTANDILTKLKTVDGAGSGLDADMLDGKHITDLTEGKPGNIVMDVIGKGGDYISNSAKSVVSIKCYAKGTFRFKYAGWVSRSDVVIFLQLYKNGNPVSTLRQTNTVAKIVYTDDIAVTYGDIIELYVNINMAGGSAARGLWSFDEVCVATPVPGRFIVS